MSKIFGTTFTKQKICVEKHVKNVKICIIGKFETAFHRKNF